MHFKFIKKFQSFPVSMATAAILKIFIIDNTSTHDGKQSCEVSLSLDERSPRNCAESFTGEGEEK